MLSLIALLQDSFLNCLLLVVIQDDFFSIVIIINCLHRTLFMFFSTFLSRLLARGSGEQGGLVYDYYILIQTVISSCLYLYCIYLAFSVDFVLEYVRIVHCLFQFFLKTLMFNVIPYVT
jgi:hypothetical protein